VVGEFEGKEPRRIEATNRRRIFGNLDLKFELEFTN
jgi:hypothetical protein